jgi:hypothetical protein
MKNKVGIVVSRYYEDLKWIEQITSNVDVYVYNRSGESPGMGVPNAVAWAKPKDPNNELGGLDIEYCKSNGINLEIINIPDDPGFEASTYVYHMYSKYNELNDYTVFIQAHPEIYVKDVINIFNNPDKIIYTNYQKQPGGQLTNAIPYTHPDIPIPIDFEPFCDQLGTIWPHLDYQWSIYQNDFSTIPWFKFCKNMPGSRTDSSGKWYPPESWSFGAGNQFKVSKQKIQKNPVSFYKEIQEFANSYMDPNGESRPSWQQLNQGPNIMEGIWKFIF